MLNQADNEMSKSKNELDNFENFEQKKLQKKDISKQPTMTIAQLEPKTKDKPQD